MIPESMKALKQWVNWRYVERDGNQTKVPFQPSGIPAKSNDPATWSSYEEVCNGGFVGFVFAPGGGWFGVDLDDSINQPWAYQILDKFPNAYVEISPSGKGRKLFCRGANIVKGRKYSFGVGRQGIEVYGEGRYFAVTGDSIYPNLQVEPGDCSAGLAWLMAKYFPPDVTRTIYPPAPILTDRVSKYMATVPPAISGSGGHAATMYAAGVLACGFGLDDETAYNYLASWNTACVPPWSEAELRRKISEARKTNTKPIGYLLTESGEWATTPNVDLSAIGAEPISEPDRPAKPGPLPADVFQRLPGMIGEIVRHNLETALYPQPEIALAGAIALVSTLIGRKVTDGYNTRSNLYVVALAESGSGKDHSRDLNRKILSKANCSMLEGPEELASGAGIVASLVEHPARLLQVDEIGDVFGVIRGAGNKSPWLAGILRLLKSLYSSSKGEFKAGGYKSIENNKIIDQPSLTVYGSATEDFWESISPKVVKDGTLGRTIVFGPVPAQQYKGRPPRKEMPKSIIDFAKGWSGWTPGGMLANERPEALIIEHSQEAGIRAESHMTEISKKALKEEGPRRAIWMRTGEKTNKLALIFACSRWVQPPANPPMIEIDDLELAIQVANWTTRQCVAEVFDKVYDSDRERSVKKILTLCEKPQTKTAVIKATQGLSVRTRDEIMQELIQVGQIVAEVQPTRGAPRTIYRRSTKGVGE